MEASNDRHKLTLRLDGEVWERLESTCELLDVSTTAFIQSLADQAVDLLAAEGDQPRKFKRLLNLVIEQAKTIDQDRRKRS